MSEQFYIHTVTVVPQPKKRGSFFPRCWGFYATRDEAISGLLQYVDDECGYYNYAVIERYQSGIYATADQEQWFVYYSGTWHETSKPNFAEFIVNYAIG